MAVLRREIRDNKTRVDRNYHRAHQKIVTLRSTGHSLELSAGSIQVWFDRVAPGVIDAPRIIGG